MDKNKTYKCFRCQKLLELDFNSEDSLPIVYSGGMAKLFFGYGSKFDCGGYGCGEAILGSTDGSLLDKILRANNIMILICDECFENNLSELIVYNKTDKIDRIH